jgi:hypothetical protein
MGFLSELFGVEDAKSAINAAAKKSTREQQAAYGDISGMYAPYRDQGGRAFTTLADLTGINGQGSADAAMGMFQQSPGYQFRFNEGVRAIDNSGAANGNLLSGATLKGLTEFGQGIGSQEYGNWRNSLAGIADTGYNATGQTAGARGNTANALSNIYTNQGAGNANAELAGGGLLMSGFNSLANLAGMAMGGMPSAGGARPQATFGVQQQNPWMQQGNFFGNRAW